MTQAVPMVEIWRGAVLESLHLGHAVVCNADGNILHAWGNPHHVTLPRSAVKMLQALPLVESGAADRFGLTAEHLAIACGSHSGTAEHTTLIVQWLAELGLEDDALRCGAHAPLDKATRTEMLRNNEKPCQCHNSCSGKHAGFLTLAQHMRAGAEYHQMEHPVQQAGLDVLNEVTGETSSGFGIDGCAVPSHAASLYGVAKAMAFFAAANEGGTVRHSAAARLRDAMRLHPHLVAGEGRACTTLMRATGNRVAIKTGAEGVYVAILPDQKLGVALKITDGASRASELAIASILVKLGALDSAHPDVQRFLKKPTKSWSGLQTGWMQPSASFP